MSWIEVANFLDSPAEKAIITHGRPRLVATPVDIAVEPEM
jgi:hypothetical protein